MFTKSTLLILSLLVACNKGPDHPDYVVLDGYVYQDDGSPAVGASVAIEIHYCAGFCFGNNKVKTIADDTDAKGHYTLRLTDGHHGSVQTVEAYWPDTETKAWVKLTLSEYEIRLPDLHQWVARPMEEYSAANTHFVTLSWKPLPASANVPAGDEHWQAFTKPIEFIDGAHPRVAWEGINGVTVPTQALEYFSVEYYAISATKEVNEGFSYTLGWDGGITSATIQDSSKGNWAECSIWEEEGQKLRETETLMDDDLIAWENTGWVACNYPDAITISTIAWYNVHAMNENRDEIPPLLEVFVFDSEDLPAVGKWGEPLSSPTDPFGYVSLKAPTAVRWVVIASQNRDSLLHWFGEVRFW